MLGHLAKVGLKEAALAADHFMQCNPISVSGPKMP